MERRNFLKMLAATPVVGIASQEHYCMFCGDATDARPFTLLGKPVVGKDRKPLYKCVKCEGEEQREDCCVCGKLVDYRLDVFGELVTCVVCGGVFCVGHGAMVNGFWVCECCDDSDDEEEESSSTSESSSSWPDGACRGWKRRGTETGTGLCRSCRYATTEEGYPVCANAGHISWSRKTPGA